MAATLPEAIHCVGIGGAGLSAAARLLADRGIEVSGSDGTASPTLSVLRSIGIPVSLGHRADNVGPRVGAVVRSLAVPDDNPEVAAARERGLPVWSYPELVGALMRDKVGIAVAGTHGKTTTSSMLAHVLMETGTDPSVLIGGSLATLGNTGGRAGRGDHFVAEACEFQRAFLALHPTVALLTSVEPDHFDCYPDAASLEEAFGAFIRRLPREGTVVANADDLGVMRVVIRHAACRVLTYGVNVPAAIQGGIRTERGDRTRFVLRQDGRVLGEVALPIPGRHNVQNAVGAAAAAIALGEDPELVARALSTYPGVKRRFEVIGDGAGVTVVDDYAHHPTAVQAVINAARRRWPLRRIFAVFQPHQASRTRNLLGRFATALASADAVVVPEIFYARETAAQRASISSAHLAHATQKLGVPAMYLPDVRRTAETVEPLTRPGDVVLVMGAGDIAGTALAAHAVGQLRGSGMTPSGRFGLSLDEHFEDIRGLSIRDERRLSTYTTFGIGGRAASLLEPATTPALVAAVRRCHARDLPLRFLGGGSNLLVADAGYPGVVIRTRRLNRLARYPDTGELVYAEAGVGLARLVRWCALRGLAGTEVLAGIPGNLGGAVAMNAGGRHGEICDLLVTIDTVAPDGRRHTRLPAELGFGYRTARLNGEAVVGATLRLRQTGVEEARGRMREILGAKAASQPLRARSAGCVFQNPAGGSAGRLIDEAGCKGMRLGGAEVSRRHANFIVNHEGAKASDVLLLAARVRNRVHERFGITLEPELKLWSDRLSDQRALPQAI
jgi:UDP-N-acetylmuramate--L-alanine ligase/UDP-N-acetylenolpyruvoylglucosamine reductase